MAIWWAAATMVGAESKPVTGDECHSVTRHRFGATARGRGFEPCRGQFPRIVWNNVGEAADGGELFVEIVRMLEPRGEGPVFAFV